MVQCRGMIPRMRKAFLIDYPGSPTSDRFSTQQKTTRLPGGGSVLNCSQLLILPLSAFPRDQGELARAK
jgi:hypothetical protein